MKRRQRNVIILSLIDSLNEHGSWAGETHIQKAVYCLQEIANVTTGYEYILYKHGPFSFDLRDNLTSLWADGFVKLINNYPFGSSFKVDEKANAILNLFPKTCKKYAKKIEFISKTIDGKGVAELERLSTALFVTNEEEIKGVQERVQRISELKPHISRDFASRAVKEVDVILAEAKKLH